MLGAACCDKAIENYRPERFVDTHVIMNPREGRVINDICGDGEELGVFD